LLDVNVIGRKYKGMQGSEMGVMKDMYYVKLDGLEEGKCVRKTSVENFLKWAWMVGYCPRPLD